jgi:hypothetical protein
MRTRDIRHALAVLRAGASEPERLDPSTSVQAHRLGRAVRRTLRLVPLDSRCLVQSLTLTALLAKRGIGSTLVIGVRPGEKFGAHSWVELHGRALLPTGGEEFERLVDL